MEQVFSCELCTEQFKSREELNAHGSQHEALPKRPRKQYKCNLCPHEASQKCDLIRHVRTHTGERPFKCTSDGCETVFKLKSHLKDHFKNKHSNERPFKCNFSKCKYAAKISMSLTKHTKVRTDEKSFTCSECDYKTNRNTDLKRHRMRIHSGRREFKCGHPQCAKTFKSSFEMKRHYSFLHEDRNIPCDYPGCDQKYANTSALKRHKRDVHSKKSLVCPTLTCSYRTNRSTDLARHMTIHDVGKEKISCSTEGCHYKGKNTLTLNIHMRLHKTLLPCPVTGCGWYARTKKALEDHVKLHDSSDRPFQCPLCCKYYVTLTQLQQHCFAHTTEKPFACGLCDYAAPFRSQVKRHICLVHGSIKYPFIVHLLDDRECLDCKVTLPSSEYPLHCKNHTVPVE